MMKVSKFKYQKQIDQLLAIGCQLPELYAPNDMQALSEGCLKNDDGRKTSTSHNGHFDFYEYESCDLNTTFHITKILTDKNTNEDY